MRRKHNRFPALPKLDLHGKTREEAAAELDRFIDHQFFDGVERVGVVTGIGKGHVRGIVERALAANSLVARFRVLWGMVDVALEPNRQPSSDLY